MNHLPEYVALAVNIHAVALLIVNLTPTPKDNETIDVIGRVGVKAYRVIELMAGIIGPLAKR